MSTGSLFIIYNFVFPLVVGYAIFRCANSQKDRFRKDPKDPAVASKFL